jgi:putative transposase
MKYSQCLAGRYVTLKEFYLWQRRFWEHQIRDEADYHHHFDYIHYNPVKHGWVKQVKEKIGPIQLSIIMSKKIFIRPIGVVKRLVFLTKNLVNNKENRGQTTFSQS